MKKSEKATDIMVAELLKKAGIAYDSDGSNIKEIKEALKTASKHGTRKVGFPEFVAEVSTKKGNFILVIENKSDLDKQVIYDDEAETQLATDKKARINYAENGALHYAKHIIKNTSYKKVFAFGCSGDEKDHIFRPIFVSEDKHQLLDRVDNFVNFSPGNIEKYYKEEVLKETPAETLELEEIIKKAADLHEDLRNYGQLGDAEKPLVVSGILLALSSDDFEVSDLKGNVLNTDGRKIIYNINFFLEKVEVTPSTKKEKLLNQFNILKDRTLLNQKHNSLGKTPLKYFAEYLKKHVFSLIKSNSKEDILGRFYGEFISYGGGEGQSLGVVLTPGHITRLFADLVDIKHNDKVFDPCCGTGGFLISAMRKMLAEVDVKFSKKGKKLKEKEKEKIKKENLHGIEIREDMFSIATTNMILRGDGKSNLENKDFLKENPADIRKKKYTVGFMNPPYSQAKKVDTEHLSEMHFIEHLLDSLADGARGVVIVPQSTMVGKTKRDKQIKKRILEKHTLKGVITLNKNTFYGIGVNPCVAVFMAHSPHPKEEHCKFINFEDDGFEVRKHLGLLETPRATERKEKLLDCWLRNAPAESKFMVKTTIKAEDEWLHSFYYFNDEIPTEADFEKTVTDYLTFEFGMVMEGRSYLFENEHVGGNKDGKK